MSDEKINPFPKEKPKQSTELIKTAIKGIKQRKGFQIDGWDFIPHLLKIVLKAGYDKDYQSHTRNSKAYGGQYYLEDAEGKQLSIVCSDLFGQFIIVEFY